MITKMKAVKILIILTCILLSITSGIKANTTTSDSIFVPNENPWEFDRRQLKEVNPDNKYRFTYETKVESVDYSLTVETTCLNDSLEVGEANTYFPIVKQTLVFRYKDTVLKSFDHPVKQQRSKLYTGSVVTTLENKILCIGCKKGEKGVVYYIEGGSCNSCSEYFAYYSLQGKRLWHFYTVEKLTKNQGMKSNYKYDAVCKTYGIRDRDIDMLTIPLNNERKKVWKSQIIKIN